MGGSDMSLEEEIPGQLTFEDDPDYEVERFGPGGLVEEGG